jgi:hypothetical protein
MTMSIYDLTGWHTAASMADIKGDTKPGLPKYNIYRVMGYLPIAGIITGVTEINFGKNHENPSTRVYAIVRGIFEMLGLGILFLIPDAIVSIHRHFCAAKLNAQKV